MKRRATAEERRHMAIVAGMGCIVCSHCYGALGTPAHVHHVRANHGWGRSGHKAVIPLCPEHHTGKTGVHSMGRKQFEELHGVSEIRLLEIVLDRVLKGY